MSYKRSYNVVAQVEICCGSFANQTSFSIAIALLPYCDANEGLQS